jgi:hypothetical protein
MQQVPVDVVFKVVTTHFFYRKKIVFWLFI